MTASINEPSLILIADDERATRVMLRLILKKEGYQVVEATNGQECLAAYQRQKPDLVLLDALMPEMDGFTCCTKIKSLP